MVGDGTAEYVFGPAGLQQRTVGAASQYAQGDGLGSVRLITDGSGNAAGGATFEPWGAPRAGSATLGGFGFTGEQTDAETGFVYLRVRMMDPATGRFVQQDSYLGATDDPTSQNLFAYTRGNPVLRTDPSGHCDMVLGSGRNALLNAGCPGGGGGGGDVVITIAIVSAAAGVFTAAGVTISNWWQQLCSSGSDSGYDDEYFEDRDWECAPKDGESHYGDHKHEWPGDMEWEEYKQGASDLLNSQPGGDILGYTRPDGTIVRYDKETGEFVVDHPDGRTGTFMRPRYETGGGRATVGKIAITVTADWQMVYYLHRGADGTRNSMRGHVLSTPFKYPCPCCGYLTLPYKPPGTFWICPVCYWEDDLVQFNDPSCHGGANGISLNAARENFRTFGWAKERSRDRVRPPLEEEYPSTPPVQNS